MLENRPVGDTTTVELFRKKFGDDPATFMLVDHATHGETKTILFNIDIEGSINKDKTAVLRVFAKMFFSSLGFYGDNLKVAMLEQYIEHCGKTEAYRQSFRTRRGKSWEEQRKAFAFNGKYIDIMNDGIDNLAFGTIGFYDVILFLYLLRFLKFHFGSQGLHLFHEQVTYNLCIAF